MIPVTAPAGPPSSPPQPPRSSAKEDDTQPRQLADVIDSANEADPITLTDTGGTVARFDMTYSPPTHERVAFLVPFYQRLPSFVYLGVSLCIGLIVVMAYQNPEGNKLFSWLVHNDRARHLPSQALAIILIVTALATVLRSHMRGIIVRPDWIESRFLLPLGIPGARRWAWVQVNRIIVDTKTLALELSDGSFEKLPKVADYPKLRALFLAYAEQRKIQVTVLEYGAEKN